MAKHVIFLSADICDDIRIEANGKLILIGVYPTNIGVLQFPVELKLAFYIPTLAQEPGEGFFEARILSPSDAVLVQLKAAMKINAAGRGGIPVPPATFQIQEPGILKFQAKIDDGEWETVAEVEASAHPTTE